MRSVIVILGMFIGSVGLAQVAATPMTKPDVAKKDEFKKDECPPIPKADCPPKPKKKPKPKPVPKCPEAKTKVEKVFIPCKEKPCEPKIVEKIVEKEPKVIEKVVEKTKFLDRTITIDNAPKNTLNLLAGVGPHGIVTDSYKTEARKDEYAFRKEQDEPKGALLGLQYQYRFTPTFNAGGLIISNQTYMINGGISW